MRVYTITSKCASNPWVQRGGNFNNSSNAGAFNSNRNNGNANNNNSFRSVLATINLKLLLILSGYRGVKKLNPN